MTDPAVVVEKFEMGDSKEFIVHIYSRKAQLDRSGWTKTVNFYSFTIQRISPVDQKVHRFFREKDADFIATIAAETKRRIEVIKSKEVEEEAQKS